MAISFGGLASGLDTQTMITQLVAAERSTASKLTSRQSDLNTQKSIVGSLSSVLASLGTAVRGMATTASVSPRTATSSDANVSVAASSTALASPHTVRVQQLAAAQVSGSKTFASAGAGVAGTGSLGITVGGVTKTVSWTADDSLASIASKINDAGAGTSASVLFDGTSHRLVLTAQKSGVANAPAFTDGGDGLGLTTSIAAKDAIVELDGVTITRPSNVIDDALTGVTITATKQHAPADAPSAVNVAVDKDGLRDKVKAFVTASNSVNASLQVQLGYTGTTKGTNTLFGDSTLRQLQTSINGVMTRAYGGMTLADLGITRDKQGNMTLDESKLAAAVSKNGDAVSAMFASGGLSTTITSLTDEYTRGGDGILATKSKSLTDRHASLQKQVDNINRRADALQNQLERQFNALETALSNLQSQSAYLQRIL